MDVVLAISFLIFIIVTIIIMFYLRNKISKMDEKKLRKLGKIIIQAILLTAVVLIFAVIFIKFRVAVEIASWITLFFPLILAMLFTLEILIINPELKKKEIEQENQKKIALLNETEKQVKIMTGYHGSNSVLILRNLLKGATITARRNKETGKVILRFEFVDDEGKPVSKTLEFDGDDEIIHDLEIL